MRLSNEKGDAISIIGQTAAPAAQFSIKQSAAAFRILSSNLYQDKIAAVIREISCNAVDAHMLMETDIQGPDGKQIKAVPGYARDVKFEVSLPTAMSPSFVVRDFGPGLSDEQMYENYTTYFGSSKQDTDDQIGCFGLGSKSPFAVTDTFSLINRYFGTTSYWTAMVDETGTPSIVKMQEYPSQPDEKSGLEVIVPVNQNEVGRWNEVAQQIYSLFDYCSPNIKRHASGYLSWDPAPRVTFSMGDLSYDTYSKRRGNGPAVVQGSVKYTIDTTALAKTLSPNQLSILELLTAASYPVFPIGTFDVAPSRETLSYSEKTLKAFEAWIDQHIKVATDRFIDLDNKFDNLIDLRNAVCDCLLQMVHENHKAFSKLIDQGMTNSVWSTVVDHFNDTGMGQIVIQAIQTLGLKDKTGRKLPSWLYQPYRYSPGNVDLPGPTQASFDFTQEGVSFLKADIEGKSDPSWYLVDPFVRRVTSVKTRNPCLRSRATNQLISKYGIDSDGKVLPTFRAKTQTCPDMAAQVVPVGFAPKSLVKHVIVSIPGSKLATSALSRITRHFRFVCEEQKLRKVTCYVTDNPNTIIEIWQKLFGASPEVVSYDTILAEDKIRLKAFYQGKGRVQTHRTHAFRLVGPAGTAYTPVKDSELNYETKTPLTDVRRQSFWQEMAPAIRGRKVFLITRSSNTSNIEAWFDDPNEGSVQWRDLIAYIRAFGFNHYVMIATPSFHKISKQYLIGAGFKESNIIEFTSMADMFKPKNCKADIKDVTKRFFDTWWVSREHLIENSQFPKQMILNAVNIFRYAPNLPGKYKAWQQQLNSPGYDLVMAPHDTIEGQYLIDRIGMAYRSQGTFAEYLVTVRRISEEVAKHLQTMYDVFITRTVQVLKQLNDHTDIADCWPATLFYVSKPAKSQRYPVAFRLKPGYNTPSATLTLGCVFDTKQTGQDVGSLTNDYFTTLFNHTLISRLPQALTKVQRHEHKITANMAA